MMNALLPGKILYFIALFLLSGAAALGAFSFAHAGFGITPPYVKNDRLTRGSSYVQEIILVRGNPSEDLNAEITTNVPEINDWFTIDKGRAFLLEQGVSQVPIRIRVDVPRDAEYKEYEGAIRIRTSPVELPTGGGVSIALGAQIDVGIRVVDKIYDFEVRRVRTVDIEEGYRKWGLFFPGKIKLIMTIENTGNTKYGPTSVRFDLYDSRGENLLESVFNKNELIGLAPFATGEVVAEFPTLLAPGKYLAKYAIYRGDDIAQEGELNVSISPLGVVPDYEGYGFAGLSFADKSKAAGALGGAALAVFLAFFALMRIYRRQKARF